MAELCPVCEGDGDVCFDCGEAESNCLCDDGFDAIECSFCDGTGAA